ncbi:MAG: DUF3426 domain-containing protein [Lysobacteraceae bacterium]|nr:MAG: DUF3426 domain-containing protein [Xanthomonadaceae bacterium]
MFINCPYCRSLVTTDPATDRPPPRCPDCGGPLGAQAEDSAAGASDSPTGSAKIDWVNDATAGTATADSAPASGDEKHALTDSAPEQIVSDVSVGAVPEQTAHLEEDTPSISVSIPPSRPRITRHAPSFVRAPAATRPRTRSRTAIAVILALSASLCLQILLADRARLAESARWRPLLEFACDALSCDLPPWREPGAFTLLQRDVRQHPTVRGALRVSATFRNDARWAQPWPRLQLSLSDANGRRAGERLFEAREYLGGSPEQAVLGSGETAAVAMDILEPAPNIVAYDFRFR